MMTGTRAGTTKFLLQFLFLLLLIMLQLSNHLSLLQVPFHKREYTIHVPALCLAKKIYGLLFTIRHYG